MHKVAGQYCRHGTQTRTAAAVDLGCLPGRAQGRPWRIGTVEATDERDAIERVAKERNIPAALLIAQRR
jgi:hypothetical protein